MEAYDYTVFVAALDVVCLETYWDYFLWLLAFHVKPPVPFTAKLSRWSFHSLFYFTQSSRGSGLFSNQASCLWMSPTLCLTV